MEEAANPELVDMTRRFWTGLAVTVPLLVPMVSGILLGDPLARLISPRLLAWIELILATPVVLWAGWPFFQRGWASIVHRSPNMFTLVAVGAGTAYGYSVIAAVARARFLASFEGRGGARGVV